MKRFNYAASAAVSALAFTGILFDGAAAFAAPAELIAQTTVPTRSSSHRPRQPLETDLDGFGLSGGAGVGSGLVGTALAERSSACIGGCLPWVTLNSRF